jgi:hypothetical protein
MKHSCALSKERLLIWWRKPINATGFEELFHSFRNLTFLLEHEHIYRDQHRTQKNLSFAAAAVVTGAFQKSTKILLFSSGKEENSGVYNGGV